MISSAFWRYSLLYLADKQYFNIKHLPFLKIVYHIFQKMSTKISKPIFHLWNGAGMCYRPEGVYAAFTFKTKNPSYTDGF